MPFEDGKPDLAIPSGGHFEDEEPSSLWRRLVADPAISLIGKGSIGVPETAVGLADIVTGGYAGKAAEAVGFRPKEAKEYLDTLLSPEQREANRYVQEAEGFFPTIGRALERPSTIAHSVLESAPSIGAGGVIARGAIAAAPKLAPLVAGAMGEGAVSAGSTAEQIRQATPTGTLSLPQVALAAGSGAVTGGVGVAGGKLMHRLGITDIDTLIAAGKLPEGAKKNIALRIAGGAFVEGPLEELPQSAQEQIAQNLALGKPTMEGVPEAGAMGMLAGSVMGGGVAALPTKAPTKEILDRNSDPRKAAEELLQKAAEDVIRGTDTLSTDTLAGQNLPEITTESGSNLTNEPETPNDQPQLNPVPSEQATPETATEVTTQASTEAEAVIPESGTIAPKTVAGDPVESKTDEQLQALAAAPETPANTRHAAVAALQSRNPEERPTPPEVESPILETPKGAESSVPGVATGQEGGLPEVTTADVEAIKGIPTTEKMRLAIEAVGEEEFQRQAQAKIAKYRPSTPDAEAMLVEATAINILAQPGKAAETAKPAQPAAIPPAQQQPTAAAPEPKKPIVRVFYDDAVKAYTATAFDERFGNMHGTGATEQLATADLNNHLEAAYQHGTWRSVEHPTQPALEKPATTPPAPAANRIAEIDAELVKLQVQYEKKSSGGARAGMVPPSIKASALKSITQKMDRLDAERAALAAPAAQPSPAVPKPQPETAPPVEPVKEPTEPVKTPDHIVGAGKMVERFQGQYKKGMRDVVAKQHQKRLSSVKPQLVWTVEKSTIPEFPDRFDVVGRELVESSPAATPAQSTTKVEKEAQAPAMDAVEARRILRLIDSRSQSELNRAAVKFGLGSTQTSADTINRRLRDTAQRVIDAEKATAVAEKAATNKESLPVANDLRRFAGEAGWAERGGKLIRSGEGASKDEIAAGRQAEAGEVAGQQDVFARPANELSPADLLRAAAAKMDSEAAAKPAPSESVNIAGMAQDKDAAANKPPSAAAGESKDTVNGHAVEVYRDGEDWAFRIDSKASDYSYDTAEEAKADALRELSPPIQVGTNRATNAIIYRAHPGTDKGNIRAFSSWSTTHETADAYTNNPGFGGKFVRAASVDLSNTLDVDPHSRAGLARLAKELGYETPQDVADGWWDANIRYPWEHRSDLRIRLEGSGYDWIRYEDDFPEGAVTLVPLHDVTLNEPSAGASSPVSAPATPAPESAPNRSETTPTPGRGNRFEASDGNTNEAERELRALSTDKQKNADDVTLSTGKYVPLETVLKYIREVEAVVGSLQGRPAQLGFRLDIMPRDWNRVLEAAAKAKPAGLVGQLVKLQIPGPAGPMNVAGTVKRSLPGGMVEVKTQQHGYHTVAESSVTPVPTDKGTALFEREGNNETLPVDAVDDARGRQRGSRPEDSRTMGAGTGITESTLRAEISRAFGPKATAMVGDILIPLETQAEIANVSELADVVPLIREGDRISGFYHPKTGKTYLVLENIPAGEVRGTILHEIGVHAGLEGMLGKDGYAAVVRRMEVMRKAGNKAVIEAHEEAVKQAASPNQVEQETIAYLVTNRPELPFIRRLVAEIKAFLFRKFGILGDRLTPDDIVALARASVLHASEGVRNGEAQFSRAQDQTQTEADIQFQRTNEQEGAIEAPSDPTPFHQANERLRERDQTTWDRAKKYMKRQFSPGGLLPSDVFAEKVTRDSQFNAVEFDIRHYVGRLESVIRAEYKKKFVDLADNDKSDISRALAGDVSETIHKQTREAIYAMRQYIDNLSTQYADILDAEVSRSLTDFDKTDARGMMEVYLEALTTGTQETAEDKAAEYLAIRGVDDAPLRKAIKSGALTKAARAQIIRGNIGEYVHRSYQAFDDKKWFQKLDDATIDNARQYLIDGYMDSEKYSLEDAEKKAEVTLHELVKSGTAYDSMGAFVREGKLGAKDLSIMIRRKQIAPEIRALLGEYKDARLNYAKSATKMGRLIWNQRFLDGVREKGMGVFLFEGDERPPQATTQISAESSEAYAPLNGLWTFPDVEQSFKDALGKERMDQWYETIVQLNGVVKFGKTILSPTTAARNWQSAFLFTVANGHFDLKHIAKSVNGLREYFTNQGEGQKLAYLRELQELGVVYDNPYAGEMMRLLGDSKLEDTLLRGKDPLKFSTALAYAQKFYQFGDDFWKIVGFENEKQMLIKHAGMNDADAKKEAAERIRNTYPTYSMVGRAMHFLRRFPLAGTFVSFPSEIIRTVGNMIRYTAQDYKDPKMRPLAIRRMQGFAIAAGFAYALQAMTKAMLGLDDDDEEAVRDLSPTWSKNSNFLFLGRNEKGQLQYVDLSYIDPYNYFKRPLTAILRNQPWEKVAADVFRETLAPFLGTDIAAGAIFEVMSNKKESGGKVYLESDKPWRQTAAIADHMRKTLQPGFASNLERTYKALSGQVSMSGKKYDPMEEAAGWAGWRMSTLDPKVALYYRTFEFTDQLREASSAFNQVARNPNEVSTREIKNAVEHSRSMRRDAFREMTRIIAAVRSSGISNAEIFRILRGNNVSQRDAAALIRGTVPVWRPTPLAARSAARRADALLGAGMSAEFAKRYREAMTVP